MILSPLGEGESQSCKSFFHGMTDHYATSTYAILLGVVEGSDMDVNSHSSIDY